MKTMWRYVMGGLVTAAAAAVTVSVAPPAEADCVSTGGVTVCAQGGVSGGGQSADSASGPYYPYDCQDDYLCSNGPDSLAYGGSYSGGCTTPYGTYQNCNARR